MKEPIFVGMAVIAAVMTLLSLASLTLTRTVQPSLASAKFENNVEHPSCLKGKVLAMTLWRPVGPTDSNGVYNTSELTAQLVANDDIGFSRLQILRDGNLIYEFNPHQLPGHIEVLDDGNLAVCFSAACGGDSLSQVTIFGYSKGRVRPVLQLDSGVPPDFVKDKNQVQKIVCSNLEYWERVQGKSSKSADIYAWNKGKERYDVRRNVPWPNILD